MAFGDRNLRPFLSFYGGKWRSAAKYPRPLHGVIIEPFAGSAGYAVRYPDRQVHLYDVDERIAGVWDYLIATPESEIRRLPLEVAHIDDLTVPEEAKHLIGFWLNSGAASPRKTPSSWMRAGKHATSFWGEVIRERIASQVPYIRHWTITHGSYEDIPDQPACWFVDPPYSTPAGHYYRHNVVDFASLGAWAKDREGQVIVCEQEGADWLPFDPLGSIKSTRGRTGEVIWTQGCD
jgi:hypothetical protein